MKTAITISLLSITTAVGSLYQLWKPEPLDIPQAPATCADKSEATATAKPAPDTDTLVMNLPGRSVEKVYPADQIEIGEHHYVTGIVINGKPRAYLEAGMSQPKSHVAYDRLGGQDIAIAFCDRTGDAQAFCGMEEEIRGIRVGGWRNENMELIIGGNRQPIDASTNRLATLDFKTVKWAEWKQLHPDTDIYLGDHEYLVN